MNYEEAIDKVCSILINKIHIPPALIVEENFNEPFTGSTLNLDDQQMMYLFLELEKQCNVHLKTQLFADEGFNSIEKAAKILMQSL